MLVQMLDKQRRGVSVIKTALLAVGITGRSICINADSWLDKYGGHENYGVFVSAPEGVNEEPFYVTGKTIVEAVKNMIVSIKGRASDAKTGIPEVAPF